MLEAQEKVQCGLDRLQLLSVHSRNAFRIGQWAGDYKDRFHIKIKMSDYLEQITNGIFCAFESLNEVLCT